MGCAGGALGTLLGRQVGGTEREAGAAHGRIGRISPFDSTVTHESVRTARGVARAPQLALPAPRRYTATLTGMAGAMGALFPSPVLAVILLVEVTIYIPKSIL